MVKLTVKCAHVIGKALQLFVHVNCMNNGSVNWDVLPAGDLN